MVSRADETGPFWDHGDDHECPDHERCSECGSIPLHILHAGIDFDDGPTTCPRCDEPLNGGTCDIGCNPEDTRLTEIEHLAPGRIAA